jgi:hypothetical protein
VRAACPQTRQYGARSSRRDRWRRLRTLNATPVNLDGTAAKIDAPHLPTCGDCDLHTADPAPPIAMLHTVARATISPAKIADRSQSTVSNCRHRIAAPLKQSKSGSEGGHAFLGVLKNTATTVNCGRKCTLRAQPVSCAHRRPGLRRGQSRGNRVLAEKTPPAPAATACDRYDTISWRCP